MAKLLLVEDDAMIRELMTLRLSRKGHQVLCATNGEEGVAMAHAEQPDLILMDMSLPGMDGWDATRLLKADPQTGHIP
ncbi:MAG: response regulator, partial [Caldilineae bacterium]